MKEYVKVEFWGSRGQKVQIGGIKKFGTWLDKLHSVSKRTNIWRKMFLDEMHRVSTAPGKPGKAGPDLENLEKQGVFWQKPGKILQNLEKILTSP